MSGSEARLASEPHPNDILKALEGNADDAFGEDQRDLDEMLYARHAEIESLEDLVKQRGTNIPALYNQIYKFIQNPSTVSVETFRRMVDTDDTIGSGVDFLTTCLAARMGNYTHPSEEISKWVNDRLNEIDGGWVNTMKEMLSATWAGFYVGEKVWANTINGFVPKKIVHLPPGTILFETDRTGELTPDGILQYQRNYNPALFGGGIAYLFGFMNTSPGFNNNPRPDMYAKLGDYPFPLRSPNIFSYLSIRIPIRKCIHYSYDAQGKFGSPYGKSLLRRAYKHWVLKDAVMQMLSVALDRKGTPLQVWYVDPNATFIDTQKWNGQPVGQQSLGIRAQEAVRQALSNVHNDSVVIMPGKKGQFVDHDFIPQTSNASDFIATLEFLNKCIMRSLLLPSLVFSGGDGGGSYALGTEHAKTFDKILDGILNGFQQVLLKQLVQEMIAYNFPKSAWEKDGLGEFMSRELTMDEREKEMGCVETAVRLGAVDMNELDDLNKTREIAGFSSRDTPIPPKMDMFGDSQDPEDQGEEDEVINADSSDEGVALAADGWKLLASGPSVEAVIKMIEKFWYAKPGEIEVRNEEVYKNGKLMSGFRVVGKGGRFRFEGKID